MNKEEMFEDCNTTYIRLSNGRVGYVENINDERFIADLKRLNLTYEIISFDEYNLKTIINTLSPEQVYRYVLGGKKVGNEE